jgi:hypothetical protein
MLSEPEGRVLGASALTALTVGTVVYTIVEGWSPLDSLYFSVVTLATVGFGDLHPTTDVAKLFTIGYIFTGVGILAGFVSELTKVRHAVRSSERPGPVAAVVETVERDIESVAEHGRRPSGPHGGPDGEARP